MIMTKKSIFASGVRKCKIVFWIVLTHQMIRVTQLRKQLNWTMTWFRVWNGVLFVQVKLLTIHKLMYLAESFQDTKKTRERGGGREGERRGRRTVHHSRQDHRCRWHWRTMSAMEGCVCWRETWSDWSNGSDYEQTLKEKEKKRWIGSQFSVLGSLTQSIYQSCCMYSHKARHEIKL